MENDQTIATINNLIQTLEDGELGFRTAAEGLTDPHTKALFQQFSRERGQMARDLQAEVTRLGGEPETAGSVSGSLHRGWINIKSVVTGKSDASIIAEAERGEDIAKQAFAEAIAAGLPPSVLAIVEQQAVGVRAAHDRVRAMEQSVSSR
jgi:uncharacterized protein (TIGR02284 family)